MPDKRPPIFDKDGWLNYGASKRLKASTVDNPKFKDISDRADKMASEVEAARAKVKKAIEHLKKDDELDLPENLRRQREWERMDKPDTPSWKEKVHRVPPQKKEPESKFPKVEHGVKPGQSRRKTEEEYMDEAREQAASEQQKAVDKIKDAASKAKATLQYPEAMAHTKHGSRPNTPDGNKLFGVEKMKKLKNAGELVEEIGEYALAKMQEGKLEEHPARTAGKNAIGKFKEFGEARNRAVMWKFTRGGSKASEMAGKKARRAKRHGEAYQRNQTDNLKLNESEWKGKNTIRLGNDGEDVDSMTSAHEIFKGIAERLTKERDPELEWIKRYHAQKDKEDMEEKKKKEEKKAKKNAPKPKKEPRKYQNLRSNERKYGKKRLTVAIRRATDGLPSKDERPRGPQADDRNPRITQAQRDQITRNRIRSDSKKHRDWRAETHARLEYEHAEREAAKRARKKAARKLGYRGPTKVGPETPPQERKTGEIQVTDVAAREKREAAEQAAFERKHGLKPRIRRTGHEDQPEVEKKGDVMTDLINHFYYIMRKAME